MVEDVVLLVEGVESRTGAALVVTGLEAVVVVTTEAEDTGGSLIL